MLPELQLTLVLCRGAPPPLSLLGQVRLGHTPPPQLFEQSRRRPLQLPATFKSHRLANITASRFMLDCDGFISTPGGGAADCSFVPGCFLFLTFWLLCTDLMRTVIDAEQREDKSKDSTAFRRPRSNASNAKSCQRCGLSKQVLTHALTCTPSFVTRRMTASSSPWLQHGFAFS